MVTDGYANRLNGVEFNAVDERRFDAPLLTPGGPVSAPFSAKSGRRVNGAGLVVSVGGSPEAWTCTAGPGVIYDAAYASQGAWRFEIPNSKSENMPARPGSGQTRIDLIVARIYDNQAIGSGPTEVKLERVSGTPGAPGTAPSLPPLSVELARLSVPNTGSITVTQSTERTVAAGGILPVATSAAMDKLTTDGVAYAGLVVNNAQTNALHRYDGTNWKRVGPQYSPVPTPTVDGSSSAPRDDQMIRLLNWVSATTTNQGLVTVPWPTPFPNGILHAVGTTTSGASQNPVVNAGAITKTSCTFIFPGVFNAAVKFTYEAVGW